MSIFSASYNFPDDFFWGIVPYENFLQNKENAFSFIYKLREKHISAVRINIDWADCEPVKGNYDETYIDSIRSVVSRIRNQNIESVVILNTDETPNWQNLDHPRSIQENFSDRISFVKHLMDALIPYVKFFCIRDMLPSRRFKKSGNAVREFQLETINYLHSLSENAMIGLIPSDELIKNADSALFQLIRRKHIQHLQSLPIDFLGIESISDRLPSILPIFNKKNIPLMVISDQISKTPDENRSEILCSRIYDIWNIYQKGWPVIGYMSDTDIRKTSQEVILYEVFCKNNAFCISSEMRSLPEKWISFLKR